MDTDYASLSREELIFKLQTADHVICEQKKLLQAKETMLQNYVQQFRQLTSDYERLIGSHYGRNDYSDIDAQPEPVVQSRRDVYSRPDPSQSTFMEPMAPPVQQQAPPGRRALVSQIAFGDDGSGDPRPISSVKQARGIPRTAMNDHFNEQFGEPSAAAQIFENERAPMDARQLPPLVVDTTGMSVDEMRAKVDELNIQRAEMERQLNKVLPKGKVMAHVMREREELERHFEEISRVIAHIKLEIRQAQKSG